MWKLKIKNVRKSNSTKGANAQNSWSAGGDPLENPSGMEHAEWDFDLYMDMPAARVLAKNLVELY